MIVLLTSPPLLKAQRADSLRVGANVRVERKPPNPQFVHGTYVTRDSISFVITTSNRTGDLLSIPVQDISGVEIPAGMRPRGEALRRGAGLGALAGLAIGAMVVTVVAISDGGTSNSDWYPPIVVAGAMAVVTTVAGTVVGAVTALVGRQRWAEVPFRP